MQRLSDLERRVMRWLAVEREPVSFAQLADEFAEIADRGQMREAVEAVRHRSLVERREPGPRFTLQSVVLEYVTDQLVEDVARDIVGAELADLRAQALVKATAKEYVRASQERLIAAPVLDRLGALLGNRQEVERRLIELCDQFRRRPRQEHGYGPGNVVNLLRLLCGDVRGWACPRCSCVRHFWSTSTHRMQTWRASTCPSPSWRGPSICISVALSSDGAHVLAGTTTGEVCLWRAADRTLLLSVPAHTGVVMCVALSAERGLIPSASQDGTVKLWRAPTGNCSARWRARGAAC
jgi:hypothetical protein